MPLRARSLASAEQLLRDDALRAQLLRSGPLEFNERDLTPTVGREPVTPEDLTAFRVACERTQRDALSGQPLKLNREDVEGALLLLARRRPYDPVREYLDALRWDRRRRLCDLPRILAAEQTPLNEAVLRKFLIAAVARAFLPGCKADNVLILYGPQGGGKSTFFRTLAGEYFSDTPIIIGDKDSYLALRRTHIYELAELESLIRASNQRAKSFLSAREDLVRPPYERAPRPFRRACVIVGTTNDEQFLADSTGSRRFWPVCVGKVDVRRVAAERDQLWAEAVARYRQGEPWHLSAAQEEQLRSQHTRHEVEDALGPKVVDYARGEQFGVTTADVLDHLGVPRAQWGHALTTRIGTILTRHGFQKRRGTRGGERAWVYQLPGEGLPRD